MLASRVSPLVLLIVTCTIARVRGAVGCVLLVAQGGCLLTSSFEHLGDGVPDSGAADARDADADAEAGACATLPCAPEVVVSNQKHPRHIALDGDYVYFGDTTAGSVFRAPKNGGPVIPIATAQNSPQGIAVDTTRVFWTENTGTVHSCPLAGCGAPDTLATTEGITYGIALDASFVYWGTDVASAVVRRREKTAASPAETIASAQDYVIDIAVDDSHVYWTNSGGSVARAPKLAGATAQTLAPGELQPFGIALDANYVYFTARASGMVKRVLKTGGPVTTIASAQNRPEGIAVDADTVYWANNGLAGQADGVLMSARGASAPTPAMPEPVAVNQREPFAVRVDASGIYFSCEGDGTVRRVRR
jgi:sugar lactone lactonase YvrE